MWRRRSPKVKELNSAAIFTPCFTNGSRHFHCSTVHLLNRWIVSCYVVRVTNQRSCVWILARPLCCNPQQVTVSVPPKGNHSGVPPVSVFWEEWGGHTGLLTLTLLKGSDQIFKQLKENIVCCTDFSQKAYLFLGLARQDQCNSPLRMAHTRMANYEKPSPPTHSTGAAELLWKGEGGGGGGLTSDSKWGCVAKNTFLTS